MKRQIILALAAAIAFSSCYTEAPLVPSDVVDEILFDFPQGNRDYDREIQQLQEQYGTYVIYKDIDRKLLNRAWVNVYINSYIKSDPVPEGLVQWYVDFVKGNVFRYFDPERFAVYMPKYLFLVSNMHMVLDGVDKKHMPAKTDGVDFWAVSFQTTESGALSNPDERLTRIMLAYSVLEKIVNEGRIEIPSGFYEGIDYTTTVYDDINNPDKLSSKYHYKTRGFVKYVDPSFEYNSPMTATFFSVAGSHNGDVLIYLREMLYETTAAFQSEYGAFPLVMRRYGIMLDAFRKIGIDIAAIADGTQI